MRSVYARAILLLALLLPAAARAQRERPITAEAHFAAADRAFRGGRYEAALEELRRSYAIDPRPEFLITFAQVYRALGRLDDAIAECERYLVSAPEAPLAARVQKLELDLRRDRDQRAALATSDQEDADEPDRAAPPPPSPPTPPPPAPSPPPRTTALAAPTAPAAPPRARSRSLTLAITLGVVGVVVGVAVGVGVGVSASDSPPTTKLGAVRFP